MRTVKYNEKGTSRYDQHYRTMTICVRKRKASLLDDLVKKGLGASRSELIRRFIDAGVIALLRDEHLINQITNTKDDFRMEQYNDEIEIELNGIIHKIKDVV